MAEIFAYYLITPSPLFDPAIAGRDADPLFELALLILYDYEPMTDDLCLV
jgi:hypothetical protein